MRLRIFGALMAALVCVAALSILSLASVSAGGLAPAPAWTSPRTPDGQPDLQGIWNQTYNTPLQRAARFADREFLTDAERKADAFAVRMVRGLRRPVRRAGRSQGRGRPDLRLPERGRRRGAGQLVGGHVP